MDDFCIGSHDRCLEGGESPVGTEYLWRGAPKSYPRKLDGCRIGASRERSSPPARAAAYPRRVVRCHTSETTSATSPLTPSSERLATQRRALPDQPGVYLFRDGRRKVIYVGKAKSIRKRVASHFSRHAARSAHDMVGDIGSI